MECQALLYQPHLGLGTSATADKDLSYCTNGSDELQNELQSKECRVVEVEMEVGGKASPSRDQGERQTSVTAGGVAGDTVQLPFSKELITFSLFGKMPAKHKQHRKESLNAWIEEVQQAFKNIPQMLYFSHSSVAFDGIGVYAAESLPKDTLLGPYLGKSVRKEQVDADQHNQWLWEVYEDDASLSYFVDAQDPKYGNWMNFIQCARNSLEQNLHMAQYSQHLYFVVTMDIVVGDELLVWYDQQQYDTHVGLPTAFREVPPPPLFLEQQSTPQDSADHTSPGLPPPPLHETLAPPTYSSHCPTRSSNFSDSASTDDSGISMEINGGQTPGGPPTYDLTTPRLPSPHKDGGNLPTEGACNGVLHNTTGTQLLPDLMSGVAILPTSSDIGFTYANMGSPDHLQQWYHNTTPLTSARVPGNTASQLDHSPTHTPSDTSSTWGGSTGPFVESPAPIGMSQDTTGSGGGEGKKQLLYGLFSRSEDGSRWHCEECKRLFSSQGSLRAHARIHTGERPYQCQYCFRAFCQASTLRSHERLHTGEKPYKCEDCGRAFTQSAGLRSHRKTHRYAS